MQTLWLYLSYAASIPTNGQQHRAGSLFPPSNSSLQHHLQREPGKNSKQTSTITDYITTFCNVTQRITNSLNSGNYERMPSRVYQALFYTKGRQESRAWLEAKFASEKAYCLADSL